MWNELACKLETAINRAIRRMWGGDVGNTLVNDGAIRDAIIQDVRVAIWKADANTKLPEGPEHARRWFYCVVKRAAKRRTAKQAKYLLSCAESPTEEPALERISDRRNPEIIVAARMLLERLQKLIEKLDEIDQRVLGAKIRNNYAALAVELGMDQGALRTRACRICKWLWEQLMDDDDSW